MAQKVKVQCWGPVWSEKVGCCCWVTNRSRWLLELLTELIKRKRKILLRIELNFCGALAVNWQRTSWFPGDSKTGISHVTVPYFFATLSFFLFYSISLSIFCLFVMKRDLTNISTSCERLASHKRFLAWLPPRKYGRGINIGMVVLTLRLITWDEWSW